MNVGLPNAKENIQPNGTCPPEIKELLLAAINGPHHPMPANYFEKLREHLRFASRFLTGTSPGLPRQ